MAFIRSITVVSFETSDTIKYLELNRVGFILYECPFPKNYILIIFRGCFTVQLSRFLTLFEVRQRIISYQILLSLSTLFFTFLIYFFKVSFASTRFILSKTSNFVNTFLNKIPDTTNCQTIHNIRNIVVAGWNLCFCWNPNIFCHCRPSWKVAVIFIATSLTPFTL